MNVFISYASEQAATAEDIALALREEEHEVFFDRSQLPGGNAYNAAIREAIQRCDLVVFLLSPESVAEGRYTRTELELAEEKWPSPVGHLLPVVVRPTDKTAIPPYLRAVVILAPQGNVAAEVVAAAERLSKPRWVQLMRRYAAVVAVPVVLAAGFVAWRTYEHRRVCGEASRSVQQAKLLHGAGDYAAAWNHYAEALALCPGSTDGKRGRERLAMDWLDNIRVTEGKETFTDIVNKVQRALSEAAVAADDRTAADALAHLGWADFLRSREGVGGLDPVRYYREAITRDAKNPFAHTMWAHLMLWRDESDEEANAHFASALEAGRERPYVRSMQLVALQLHSEPSREDELMRVLTAMRVQGDPLPAGTEHDSPRWRIWNVYYGRLYRWNDRPSFLAAVPSKDHLATFRWIFPDSVVPEDKKPFQQFMLAQLEENDGDRAGALATYESLLSTLATQKWESPITQKSREAVKRLKAEKA